jgi:hypothetical protein
VIRDVAIARRSFGAHTNRTPNHAPTLSPNASDHESAVVIVAERRPSNHASHTGERQRLAGYSP